MRSSFALLLLLPAFAPAQPTAEQKKETVKWVLALADPNGGFYPAPPDPTGSAAPKPSLRATSAGVRTLKYLGAEVPNTRYSAPAPKAAPSTPFLTIEQIIALSPAEPEDFDLRHSRRPDRPLVSP